MDQTFSFFPSIPVPVQVRLHESTEHACPYLPDRLARTYAFAAGRISGEAYHACLDANFRRSGRVIYQPVCRGCRRCISLRVPVATFQPSKSQARAARKNQDLNVSVGTPTLDVERNALYAKYVTGWHKREAPEADDLENFLYSSPTDTLEFSYRDPAGRLLAIGICDVLPAALSSVYFFFDPADAARSLGTASAVHEIAYAAAQNLVHYYLGYWVNGSPEMQYKTNFRPCELLGSDGVWRSHDTFESDSDRVEKADTIA